MNDALRASVSSSVATISIWRYFPYSGVRPEAMRSSLFQTNLQVHSRPKRARFNHSLLNASDTRVISRQKRSPSLQNRVASHRLNRIKQATENGGLTSFQNRGFSKAGNHKWLVGLAACLLPVSTIFPVIMARRRLVGVGPVVARYKWPLRNVRNRNAPTV